MSYTFTDAEIGLTESASGGFLLVQRVGDRKEQGGTQLAFSKANICEVKISEICRKFIVTMLAFTFLNGKNSWGHLKTRLLGTIFTPVLWLMLVALTLLPCCQLYLYVLALLVSVRGGGWFEIKVGLYEIF